MNRIDKLITNLKVSWDDAKRVKHNEKYIPTPIMGIIAGKTNCGKTSLLLKMLLNPGLMNYKNIILISYSCSQPKYSILKKCFDHGFDKEEVIAFFEMEKDIQRFGVDNFFENYRKRPNVINFDCFSPDDKIPKPEDLKNSEVSIVIFDDMMVKKNQEVPKNFFCRGRHNLADCFYIAQNYHKIDRQCIRGNANFIILFEQPKKDINHIYEDLVSLDMSKDEFIEFCKKSWDNAHGYIIIDTTRNPWDMKYRNNLTTNYIPKKYQNDSTINERNRNYQKRKSNFY